MRKIEMKKTGSIIIGVMLMVTLMASSAFAMTTGKDAYDINTLKGLKSQLNAKEESGALTESEKRSIMDKASPSVVAAFDAEKMELAKEELNALDLDVILEEKADGTLGGTKTIDLGNGCEVTVELKEGEDFTVLEKIRDAIFQPAYAATNGETMWKDYGNRYFTAKVTTVLGAGTCTMSLENHYNLSSSGITERYGVSDAVGLSATTKITAREPVITDRTATTPGSSDVNMYCKYDVESATTSGNYRLNTTVGYLQKDSTGKRIKVKHSWNWS